MTEGTFQVGELITGNATGFNGDFATISSVTNNGLFAFGETISNLDGNTAKVEEINLEGGQQEPLGTLRYGIGTSTTSFEVLTSDISEFAVSDNVQIASEIMTITAVTAGSESGIANLQVSRAQLGTSAISHLQSAPLYGTDIEIGNNLILSKTAGTYQSTPGLFDIELNDIIIGAKSGVVATVTATSPYQDPATQQFISQVNISPGASFSGLLFNRITSINYQNVVLDDISASQISIVDFDDNTTPFDSNFPANEIVNNIVIDVVNVNGTFQEGEKIRNNKVELSNKVGDFITDESTSIRKLTHKKNTLGSGFFTAGQIIRNTTSKAEVIGYNQARKTVYLGKVARSQYTGEDYHVTTFNEEAQLDTSTKRYGLSSLLLARAYHQHTFVSGVADAITSNTNVTYTAATGTTYDPVTGVLVLEIGAHGLSTSETITIADNGLVFTCGADAHGSNHPYPRSTDPASGSTLAISATSATTITVNVGAANGTSDFLSIPTSTEFGFGTGNFTIEFWMRAGNISGTKALIDFRSTATELAPYLYLDGMNLKYYNNGSVAITGATNLGHSTWYHVALSRSGSSTKLFLNGVQEGSTYTDSSNYGTTKPIKFAGDYAGANTFSGHLDELRVSSVARYTADFTAPTGLFQGDADTKLLLHFDGVDGQVHTDDWSGTASWTEGDDFCNDALRETQRNTGGKHIFVEASADAIAVNGTNEQVSAANYNQVTGDLVLTIGSHSYTTSNTVVIAANALTFTCSKDNHATNHTYPRLTDPAYGATLTISAVTGTTLTVNVGVPTSGFVGKTHRYIDASRLISENRSLIAKESVYQMRQRYPNLVIPGDRFTPTGATYDATTGLLTMSVSANTLTNGGKITPRSATYDAATGDMTIAATNHGLSVGQRVNIKVNSMTFTCSQDSNATEHEYPRPTDPAAGDWIAITSVPNDHEFVINVSASPSGQQYTHAFVSADTDAITVERDRIKINPNALTFTCSSDNNQTEVTYPRPRDPATKFNALPVVDASSTSITVNVGTSPFVYWTPTGATYDAATGDFVMTIPNHTINAGTKLRLANLGFTFTCSQDNNGSQHQYPRSTDPAYNTTLNVTSVGTTTADITGATYVPTTGILTITSNGHNLSTGDHIQIASESLTFTCAYDSNATNHTYPRQSDPIWGLWQPVTVVDGNTFTLDIGTSTDTTTHSFVSATTGALIKQTGAVTINVGASPSGQQYTHTWVSNVANAVITGGAYVHTFKSAVAGGVVADQKVNCEDDVLDLTDALVDDLRNGSNTHLWDASALYVNRAANPVQLNHVETEIPQTLWVLNKHVELVNKIINNELITIQGDHGLTQYTDTTIYDSNNYGSLTQLTPSGATYDPATGEMVITSAGHNLSTSSKVSFADDSFTFTCSQDNNASQHTYPRSTDPAYRRVLSVTAVSTNTFTVNVGVSPADRQYTHVFVSAATNAVTVLDYTSADCADVKQTIQNLMDIVVDTLTNANLPSPVDYLGTVTKLFPVYEFLGSYVDSFSEVPIELTDVFNNNEIVYANKFNVNAQYRFRDAANLIRLNRKAIVDKAAVDMINRYPHLALSMPRNEDGSGSGTLRCKTDLGLILDAVANDIEEGGNLNLLTGLGLYFGANDEILHVRLQLVEGCYAHERLAFYAKQAVTGDLDSTNTDAVIVGDWGITNDPGNCANVTSAIDALIDLANISLAPTGDRYRDAADLLLFNKDFIADEATLLLDAAFAYQLGVASYNAFTYPGGISVGRENCKDDIKDIIDSVIADLLTGGNSNTVKAIEYYITSSNGLKQFEDQILPAMYAYQQVRFLGKKAIRNLLVGIGDSASGDQYRAQYTPETPYTDLTITDESGNSTYSDDDCADVINAFDNLIDLIIDTLTPGDTASRAAEECFSLMQTITEKRLRMKLMLNGVLLIGLTTISLRRCLTTPFMTW